MKTYCFLLTISVIFIEISLAQICPNRSITADQFGFIQASNQLSGNQNYAYLAFSLNVKNSANSLTCGSYSDIGMQQVEAAIWALDTFSRRLPGILTDISVGGLILNSCNSPSIAVQQVSNLETCETVYGSSTAVNNKVEPGRVYAYVGLDSVDVATAALPITTSLEKTSLTFELTSLQFTKTSYPYLVKLRPCDETEVDGFVELIKASGLKYVQIVKSSTTQYKLMATLLESKLRSIGVCVSNNLDYSASAVSGIKMFLSVRPVFLLLSQTDIQSFITQVKAASATTNGYFSWIIPSEHYRTIAALAIGREEELAGAVVMTPFETEINDFNNYYRNLHPNNATHSVRNPWLDDYWMTKFSCNLPGKTGQPTACGSFADPNNFKSTVFDPSVYQIIKSVEIFVRGLQIARDDTCGTANPGLCSSFRSSNLRYKLLNTAIYKISSTQVDVNSTTGELKQYSMMMKNYQKNFPGYTWINVRSWASGVLNVVLTNAVAAYGTDGRLITLTSTCDAACQRICPVANVSTTTTTTTSTSSSRSSTEASNTDTKFRKQYWVYALIVCASLGVLVTLFFMIYILMRVLTLPSELKNFTTLWLGEVLLITILVGYVLLFAWCTWPTPAYCGVIRFMLGVVYASMFAILLIKLLALITSSKFPTGLPSTYQVLLYLFALSVQIAISAEWIILVPAGVVMKDSVQVCNHNFEQHLQSLVYCMALILLCTIVAIRAHNIGKNNREAIFIGLAVGLSIPIWIAWALVGALNNSDDFKDGSLAFGLFVNLTLVLMMVFLPKVYQLQHLSLDDDEQNIDELDDAISKEPIYLMTNAPPSLAGGEIYLTTQSPGYFSDAISPSLYPHTEFVLSNPPPGKAQSISGRVMPVSYDLNGKSAVPLPKKAYSEINFNSPRSGNANQPNKNKGRVVEMGYL